MKLTFSFRILSPLKTALCLKYIGSLVWNDRSSPGTELFFTGNFSQTCTLFSKTFKVPENRVPLFFQVLPKGRDIDDSTFLPIYIYEITCKAGFTISYVVRQYPSDIMH